MLPGVAQREYHIVVKVFACLRTLSSLAAANGLAFPDTRSLANHLAEFTKVSPFFGFVDTGDAGYIPTKICGESTILCLLSGADCWDLGNLKLYIANANCKHVFLAAAGSSRYHDVLRPYRGQTRRITLAAGFVADEKMHDLGLRVQPFPKVFAVPLAKKTHLSSTLDSAMAMENGEDNPTTVCVDNTCSSRNSADS